LFDVTPNLISNHNLFNLYPSESATRISSDFQWFVELEQRDVLGLSSDPCADFSRSPFTEMFSWEDHARSRCMSNHEVFFISIEGPTFDGMI